MAMSDLTLKEMELVLRLYLNRIDTRPLYWYYFNTGHGTAIKARHKGENKTITWGDLLEFLYDEEKIILEKGDLLVLMENNKSIF